MYKLFSNWIFCWFYLFSRGYTKANPLVFLIVGYIFTVGGFIYIYNQNAPKHKLKKFIIINLIIKFLFILIIMANFTFIFSWDDIIIGVILYISYLFVLVVNKINPVDCYLQVFDTYINDDPDNKKFVSGVSRLYDTIYFNLLHKK